MARRSLGATRMILNELYHEDPREYKAVMRVTPEQVERLLNLITTRVPHVTVRLALASYCRTRPNDASDGRAAVMCELLPGEQAIENKKC